MPDLSSLYAHWYPGQAAKAGPPVPTGQTPLASGPVFNYSAPFGGNPTVPSPAGTQAQAISGNVGNLGGLYGLGQSLNQFTAQQAPASLNLNLPNYQASNQVLGGDILSKLQGQVPQDVLNQIQQLGAERGVATGSIGSPNSNAAMLRALGLTSLDLQNQGAQQFSQAIAQTPQGQQFNPFGFLVTPEQQQQAQYQANLLNAAPVPSSAQYANLNALQQGRQSAQSLFPSSAPQQPSFPTALPPALQPLGGFGQNTPGTGEFDAQGNYIGDIPPEWMTRSSSTYPPVDYSNMFSDFTNPDQSSFSDYFPPSDYFGDGG